MFRKMLLVAMPVLLVAIAGCKRPMTEFTSTQYQFKAKFPGKPKEQEQTLSGIKLKTFMTETRNGAYMVGVSDMPVDPNEPEEITQQRLDGSRDAIISGANGTITSSNSIRLAGKHPGREFSGRVTKPVTGTLRVRLYRVGTRLYEVMVLGTDSYANSAEATQFLDSFQVIP